MTGNALDLRKLIQMFATEKITLDKKYFENIIQPTWEAFELVHKDYKGTFSLFSTLFQVYGLDKVADKSPLDSLVNSLKEYWTFTSELRSELEKLLQSLSSLSEAVPREGLLLDFVKAIDAYFEIGKLHGEDMLLLKNLQIQLKYPFLSTSPSRVKPLQLINTILNDSIEVISSRYPDVESSYNALRTELLT